MKKLYFLLLIVVFSGYIFGQSINMNDQKINAPKKQNTNYNNKLQFKKISGEKYQSGLTSHLKSAQDSLATVFDYTSVWEDSLGINGLDNFSSMMLFPDSLVKIHYLNGDFGFTNIPGIAVTVDAHAPIFKNYRIDITKKYILDTIGIPCWYSRSNTTSSEINNADTLLIDIVEHQPFITYYPDTGTVNTYGDTVYVEPICFDNRLRVSQRVFDSISDSIYSDHKGHLGTYTPALINRYKILLTPQTVADTFTWVYHKVAFRGVSYLMLPAHLPIIPKDSGFHTRFSVAVTFRPGYTYVEGDLFNQKNSIELFTYEEHDSTQNNTHPKYPGSWPSYSIKDLNCSYIIPIWWDQITAKRPTRQLEYIPEYAWTSKTFAYENDVFQFKLRGLQDTSKIRGISENAAKTLKIVQNYPNPADKYTIINYELTQPDNVTLIVTDLTGNKVMEINKGNQTPGNYAIRLNTSSLSCGMYFYTIKVNNSSLSQKFIINR